VQQNFAAKKNRTKMAGKPKPMSQIKQLMILYKQGKGRKTIARILGISKNTVKTYLEKLEVLQHPQKGKGWTIKDLLDLQDPVLEAKFHAGNPAYKDERYEDFKSRLPDFLEELKKTGVTRHLLWQEYKQQQTEGYGYSQFCYHLHQQQVASRPSMVLEHKPGDKLFIDFAGKKLYYTDKETGEIIKCDVFVACLPYSDYSFAMALKGQTIGDLLQALSCCLQHLGGVPHAIVPDNLKAAITKASRYEPDLNRALEDFANHYGTSILPARVGKPKDKALVENQVKLIYNRVYAQLRNMQFFDLKSLNEAITEKIKAHNQTRMKQKPYCREERFLAEEKKLLAPLPTERYELKSYTELTVAKNNHIQLYEDKHYYSVPYRLIGQKVKVIYTANMVYIYSKGTQVAAHIRSHVAGRYTTFKEHLCSHHQHYKDRSPQYYVNQAEKKSASLHKLVLLIFKQDRYPEQLYKTCEGLFSLYRKTEPQRFEKACQLAIEYQNYSYKFMLNLLQNRIIEQAEESITEKNLPKHKNLRGKQYYQQQIPFKIKNDESD
jgi:transposase